MKQSKPKKVSYELIDRLSPHGVPMYALLDELIDFHHEELREARIALAWCTSWNVDVDGRVTLGKCKRAGDLDREMAAFDFVIMLRKSFWLALEVSPHQRRALLDHELCHAALKYDTKGQPVYDERGRLVFRTRRHDLEEFAEIAKRYGLWKADLEQFAAALRAHMPAFKPCELCIDSPGYTAVIENGIAVATRCECFLKWAELRDAYRDDATAVASCG